MFHTFAFHSSLSLSSSCLVNPHKMFLFLAPHSPLSSATHVFTLHPTLSQTVSHYVPDNAQLCFSHFPAIYTSFSALYQLFSCHIRAIFPPCACQNTVISVETCLDALPPLRSSSVDFGNTFLSSTPPLFCQELHIPTLHLTSCHKSLPFIIYNVPHIRTLHTMSKLCLHITPFLHHKIP